MKKKDLLEYAKSLGLDVKSSMTKVQIEEMIREYNELLKEISKAEVKEEKVEVSEDNVKLAESQERDMTQFQINKYYSA